MCFTNIPQVILSITIFISLFLGSFFALSSSKFKTFLAYSSITDNAFFLATFMELSVFSTKSLLFYLWSYNIATTLIFIPLMFFRRADTTIVLYNVRDFLLLKKGFYLSSLIITLLLVITFGLPPFIGFFAKLFILNVTLTSNYFLYCNLTLFLLIISFYYIRFSKIVFFTKTLKHLYIQIYPSSLQFC